LTSDANAADRSWRDATGDLIGIALLLTRLSLDSHASSLLGPIQAAISALVNAIQSQPQAVRSPLPLHLREELRLVRTAEGPF
jgi:hypothetical protein